MREQEIKKRLDAEPFKPFVLHLSDGSRYEIHDAGGLYVTRSLIPVGLDPDAGRIPQDSVMVDPIHVTRISPLKPNGRQRRR
jgi:hypothetical protein